MDGDIKQVLFILSAALLFLSLNAVPISSSIDQNSQVGNAIAPRMPVDMYYRSLDGNWNANGIYLHKLSVNGEQHTRLRPRVE